MTISDLKVHSRKLVPKVTNIEILKKLIPYIILPIDNKHPTRKKKYIRGNNKPFPTKAYSKAIMQRTSFRNKFLKNPTNINKILYNKQRNYCVKPFLSDRLKSKETIVIVNNDNVGYYKTEVVKTFDDFSSDIVKNLEITEYKCHDDLHNRLCGSPVLQVIMKYRNHPSIKPIHRFSQNNSSYFSPVDKNTVLKEKGLNANKAVQDNNIPVKVLKKNANFFAEQITFQFNEDICSSNRLNL